MIAVVEVLLQPHRNYSGRHFTVFLAASLLIHGALLFSVSLYGSNNPVTRHELFDVDYVAPEERHAPDKKAPPPAPEIKADVPPLMKKPAGTAALKKPVIQDPAATAPVPVPEKEATVSLDRAGKKPSRYDPYLQHLRARINAVWEYPAAAKQQQLEGSLTLRFSIARNGSLIDVRMLRSSGADILDREALRTIHDAAPFMPLPGGLAIERLHVLASFDYQFAPEE
jgi:TonB family protein